MKYFLDTEFIEDGKTIDLLSLALVAEDDREIYVVNKSADHSIANWWVRENVLPHLDEGLANFSARIPHNQIAVVVKAFVGKDPKPEFWGYYADYDWVAFCQLFGTMMDLPPSFPMYCRDIKQWCDQLGNPDLPPQGKGGHHALLDARWNKTAHDFLAGIAGQQIRP